MTKTSYLCRLTHGHSTRLRVLMNGIPFYRSIFDDDVITWTDGANHLLEPGENTITLQLYEAPTHITVITEVNIAGDHDSPVVRFDWPKMWYDIPKEVRQLPFFHTARFDAAPDITHRHAYLDAPTEDFGPEGTKELRAAVQAFHDAVASGDTDAFCQAVALKSSELSKIYDHDPRYSLDDARSSMADVFSKPTRHTRQLDMDQLIFESCRDGRVAYVTRADGFAIESTVPDEGELSMDLWLTRHQGTWKIFR